MHKPLLCTFIPDISENVREMDSKEWLVRIALCFFLPLHFSLFQKTHPNRRFIYFDNYVYTRVIIHAEFFLSKIHIEEAQYF